MAEQPFKVRKLNVNGSYILASDFDPSVTGIYAPVPSLYFRIGYESPYNIYIKTGSSDTDWIPLANKSVVDLLNNIFTATNEPSGFPIDTVTGEVDRTSSTISFNESNRTFTIAPSGSNYYFFAKGVKYTKTTAINLQIPTTAGSYYFYFDYNGDLQYLLASSFPVATMLLNVFVAMVSWNGSQAVIVGDERHGCTMDAHTHARFHTNQGAVYLSGMGLDSFILDGDGSLDTQAQFSIGSGTFRDEDILHSLSSINSTTSIPEIYRTGSGGGIWNLDLKTNFKFLTSVNNLIEYNSNSGTWARTEVGDNKYVLRHILATNDIRYPYLSLMGTAEYLNKSDARTNALIELLSYTGLPFVEFVPIATYIIQSKSTFTNSVNAIIVSTDTGASYIDWRKTGTYLNPNVSGVNVHNNLGGLQGGGTNFYHSDQPINTTDIVTYAGVIDTGKLAINFTSNSSTGTLSAISTLNTSAIRFSPSTTTSITGFNNSENGKLLWIHNAGSVDITIENQSSTETTASNRIITGRNANITFKQNNSLLLQYDSTSSRWRIVTTVNSTNHNDLDNINGGSPYYHSDQSINKADSVQFANLLLSQNGTLTFEGSVDDNFETTLTVENPTADRTVTIPDATTTMVGTDVEQTLSNKTLASPSITGTTTITSTNTNTSPVSITANSLQDGVGIIRVSGSEPDVYFNQVSSGGFTTFTFAVNETDRLAFGKNSNDDFYITRNNAGWVNDTFVISRTTGNVSISSTTDSTNTISGSFITSGGVGIAKSLSVGNNVSIYGQYALRFYDNDSSNYIGFKSPTNVTSNITFTLPATDGTNGQVLTTDGSNNLSFTTINQVHNNLTGLYGSGNYYHSNQSILTTDSVTFTKVSGNIAVNNTFQLSSYVTVTTTGALTSSNFASGVSVIRLNPTADSVIHGIDTTDQGKVITLLNVSSYKITIANNSSTEPTASKRILTGAENDIYLNTNSSLVLIYDSGSLRWKVFGINKHNNYYDLQGGGSNNYYHSNQPINTTNSVQFDGLSIKGIYSLPTADGNSGEALITNGAGVTSFTKYSHANLSNIQGGDVGKYYHSDQAINKANDVQFGTVNINGAYSFPKTLGTNGQALISNGSALVFGTPIVTLDAYIIRYSATLNLNNAINLTNIADGIVSGIYDFWLQSDPRVRGKIYIKADDLVNSELEISSVKIGTVSGTSNRLNVYYSASNIVFENKIADDTLIVIKNI